MLIERIGAVSGYNSHKEIDFGSKLALPALLADFRDISFDFANVSPKISMIDAVDLVRTEHYIQP